MNKHIISTKAINKHRKIIIFVLITLVLFLSMSYAWYVILFSRDINSNATDIMAPYYLYLLDENANDYLQLTIGNMHPGEIKQEIICVSNEKPGETINTLTAKNSSYSYELEMAYTNNIPITYTVYELVDLAQGETAQTEGIDVVEFGSGEDIILKKKVELADKIDVSIDRNTAVFGNEMDTSTIINAGKYDLYTEDSTNTDKKLELSVNTLNNINVYEKDYYMIEIQWQQGIQFSKYTKETDLIYVIVKALQAKPEEME